MKPRMDVVWLDLDDEIGELLEVAAPRRISGSRSSKAARMRSRGDCGEGPLSLYVAANHLTSGAR